MTLSGPQLRRIQEAFLSAFPSRGALEQVVQFGLTVNLATIVRDGGLSNVVFDLLTWAESNGRTAELIEAALKMNSGNLLLKQVATDLLPVVRQEPATVETAPSSASGIGGVPSLDRSRLRKAIAGAFSIEELESLCADVQDLLARRGVELPLSLEVVGGSTKEGRVLNLMTHLERRGHLDDLILAVRVLRPGLLEGQ